jgi:hypothetical protein
LSFTRCLYPVSEYIEARSSSVITDQDKLCLNFRSYCFLHFSIWSLCKYLTNPIPSFRLHSIESNTRISSNQCNKPRWDSLIFLVEMGEQSRILK